MKTITSVLGGWTEPAIWAAALLFFAIIDPNAAPAFSLCPLHNLGLPVCPGCGLGLSISYFLHGELFRSLATHPLGIAATIILVARIYSCCAGPVPSQARHPRYHH